MDAPLNAVHRLLLLHLHCVTQTQRPEKQILVLLQTHRSKGFISQQHTMLCQFTHFPLRFLDYVLFRHGYRIFFAVFFRKTCNEAGNISCTFAAQADNTTTFFLLNLTLSMMTQQ